MPPKDGSMDVQLRDEPVSDDVRSAALLTLRRRKREPERCPAHVMRVGWVGALWSLAMRVVLGGALVLTNPQ
jgi:hypothetical protein